METKTTFFIENQTNKVIFGYELLHIAEIQNDELELEIITTKFKSRIASFHNNLIQLISNYNIFNIQSKLVFTNFNNKIKIYIYFILDNTNSINTVIKNFDHLFLYTHSNAYYNFCSINKIINLKNELSKKINDYTYLVQRNEELQEKKNNVGFNNSQSNENVTNNIFSVKSQLDIGFNNNFIDEFCNTPTHNEICMIIKPTKLNEVEKQICSDYIKIATKYFKKEEEKFLNDFLQSNVHFTSLILIKNKSQYLDYLMHYISTYFSFGESVIVFNNQHNEVLNYMYNFNNENVNNNINRLLYLFDSNSIVNVFHLPSFSITNVVESIPKINPKTMYLPKNLLNNGLKFGVKNNIPLFIETESLNQHTYIVGSTGSGKTTCLKTMIKSAIEQNIGCTIIDIHGDLYNEIKTYLKEKRINKNVYIFDPLLEEDTLNLNPLMFNNDLEKSMIIKELIEIIKFSVPCNDAYGPAFHSYFTNVLSLILDTYNWHNNKTLSLLSVLSVFNNSYLRENLLKTCASKKIVEFFDLAEKNSGDYSFENHGTYINNKIESIATENVKNILTSRDKNIPFQKIINENGILLVNIPKGIMSQFTSKFLGNLTIAKLMITAMCQEKQQRNRHLLFIDEAQNFTYNIDVCLSELRKYNIGVCLANQNLYQMSTPILESILSNTANKLIFRTSPFDYERIAPLLNTNFTRRETINMKNFEGIAKLTRNNQPQPPFMFNTIK